MATFDGVYTNPIQLGTEYSSFLVHTEHNASLSLLDMGTAQTVFLMTAVNSLGAVVHWTATYADWSALAWTGGNTPLTSVAVLARRDL